jgi:hypothetical protein
VLPARPLPNLPDRDARDHGLDVLRKYIAALVFRRTNAPGQPPIPFQIPIESIHKDQPDDVTSLNLPAIGFIPGVGRHETFGLGPPKLLESTTGVFGPGTALLHVSDYIERFTIEVWSSKIPERRAIVAGLKVALRASDASSAIYLKSPDYYGMPACVSLLESQYIDDDAAVRNRRRAFLMVELTVCEVAPINIVALQPRHEAVVLDGNIELTVNSKFELESR